MKILHIISQLPAKTGSGIYFRNVVSKMEQLGHQNAIVFGANTGYEDSITRCYPSFPAYFNKKKTDLIFLEWVKKCLIRLIVIFLLTKGSTKLGALDF